MTNDEEELFRRFCTHTLIGMFAPGLLGRLPLQERRILLDWGEISSLVQLNYALAGRYILARVLVPITLVPIRLSASVSMVVVVVAGPVIDVVPVRLNCIPADGGTEARVAHVGRGGMPPVRRDHRPAAEVPVEVLPKHARHAVQGNRIGARVQETVIERQGDHSGLSE